MNLLLVQTSCFFVIPLLTSIILKQYVYSFFMFILLYTSILNHAFTHRYFELFDRIYVIVLVATLTGIAIFKALKCSLDFAIVVTISILSTMCYLGAKYFRDPRFHALLHIFGAMGITCFILFTAKSS